MWLTCFTVFAVHKNCFHVLNNGNQTFINAFCIFFYLYKEYNSCLISFLSLFELFPALNWAKDVGNLLSIRFGVSFFSGWPFWSADSSVSNSGISVVSGWTSNFVFFFQILVLFCCQALKVSLFVFLIQTVNLLYFLILLSHIYHQQF